jgi:hypothetical protein
VGVVEAERHHYCSCSVVNLPPSQDGRSWGGTRSQGPAKTITKRKAWEATASPAVAPSEQLPTAADWIGGRALLLSSDSEGLPKASSISVTWQVTCKIYAY